jgi:cephalosporin-C deacetylase-like acetyl esterase
MDKVNVKEYVIEHSGKKIYGRLYTPAKEGKCPAVIISHGYNGSADDWVKECNFYAQNGYIAYAFDFCGGSVRSRSSGNTVDMTVFTEKDDLLDVFEDISYGRQRRSGAAISLLLCGIACVLCTLFFYQAVKYPFLSERRGYVQPKYRSSSVAGVVRFIKKTIIYGGLYGSDLQNI